VKAPFEESNHKRSTEQMTRVEKKNSKGNRILVGKPLRKRLDDSNEKKNNMDLGGKLWTCELDLTGP
jgi:hypothetical protein